MSDEVKTLSVSIDCLSKDRIYCGTFEGETIEDAVKMFAQFIVERGDDVGGMTADEVASNLIAGVDFKVGVIIEEITRERLERLQDAVMLAGCFSYALLFSGDEWHLPRSTFDLYVKRRGVIPAASMFGSLYPHLIRWEGWCNGIRIHCVGTKMQGEELGYPIPADYKEVEDPNE